MKNSRTLLSSVLLLSFMLPVSAFADPLTSAVCIDSRLATQGVELTSGVFETIKDKKRFEKVCTWYKDQIRPRLNSYEDALKALDAGLTPALEKGCVLQRGYAEYRRSLGTESCGKGKPKGAACTKLSAPMKYTCQPGQNRDECLESLTTTLRYDPMAEDTAVIADFQITSQRCEKTEIVGPKPLLGVHNGLGTVLKGYPEYLDAFATYCAGGSFSDQTSLKAAREAIAPELAELSKQSCSADHPTQVSQVSEQGRGKAVASRGAVQVGQLTDAPGKLLAE